MDNISSPPSYSSSADGEANYDARPTAVLSRNGSHNLDLPMDPAQYTRPEPAFNRAYHRAPTTPTTPSFSVAPNSPFGAPPSPRDGAWSRTRASHSRDIKQRPSLYSHDRLRSDDNTSEAHDDHNDDKAGGAAHSQNNLSARPSLRYLLYTRKGRQAIPETLRGWASNRSVLAVLLGLLITLSLIFSHPAAPLERSVSGRVIPRQKAADAVFLNNWIEHVINHPVRARDKTGFAEMGLRTEMYSHLLRHPTLPSFERMERALWPFVPGINQLRSWWQASVQAKVLQYNTAATAEHNSTSSSSNAASKVVSRAFGFGSSSSSSEEVIHGSRGIVMSLGWKGAVFASQFISIIRVKHRNDIPIELYYYGDSDLPSKYRDYLTTAHRNVRCIDLESLGLFDPDLTQLARQGFAIKPFAMLATNFTEVILADADAVLLEDPDHFFEEPGYLDTGTLFFHDRDHQRKGADYVVNEFMTNQLSLRGPSPRLASSEFWKKKGIFEQESGIVVLDKRKTDVFAALLFTCWQNMGEIRKKTTYRVFWGDKETFWLAFEFSSFPYYFVPKYAQAIGMITKVSRQERAMEVAAAQQLLKDAEAAKKDTDKDVPPKPKVEVKVEADEAPEAPEAAKVQPAKRAVDDKDVKAPADDKIVHFDEEGNALPEGDAKDPLDTDKDLEAKEEQLAATAAASIADHDDEEFCSEHPLHFLGADIDDNGGEAVVKDPLTLGRPAWFNGGILADKTSSDKIYMSPNAFTVDGAWEFLFDKEQWCIRNYTKGNLDEFDLKKRIEELGQVASKAEAAFRSVIPKPKKKKKKKKGSAHD